MISTIKTPGVYINEIDAFPPSIAQVKTAVPAFIGYTEKCDSTVENKAVKIRSLLEFTNLFGGAPSPESISITSTNPIVATITESKFKLYNSLRLFYANGGGECYIVSVNSYKDNGTDNKIDITELKAGLDILEKEDEPTLLLFPDAVNADNGEIKDLQVAALAQCADLMDRFAILDVQEVKENTSTDSKLVQSSEAFRDNIGMSNLKYGASYYPYLKTNFPYKFRLNDIQKGGVNFASIYSGDSKITTLLSEFNEVNANIYDTNGLVAKWEDAIGEKVKITDESEVDDYNNLIWKFLDVFKDTTFLTNPQLKVYIDELKNISLKPFAQRLFDFNEIYKNLKDSSQVTIVGLTRTDFWSVPNASNPNPYGNNIYDEVLIDENDLNLVTFDRVNFSKIQKVLDNLYDEVVSSIRAIINSAEAYLLEKENNLVKQMPLFEEIVAVLSKELNIVPPSGAIAGIYAQTDATRGVWKAPANVSINGIVGLNDDINDALQQEMNIHESGKSINALRKFTGKGFLVWGARTLAGNSNDWRYINVRRLANMIEESTKKACMQFVFEPNVKQTWVSVKGMIENYLTTLWNDGALAGSKREHAFFVSVGLGTTMTTKEVDDGKMIVKIGYAPSRPAEFIVLEFTQKQQES